MTQGERCMKGKNSSLMGEKVSANQRVQRKQNFQTRMKEEGGAKAKTVPMIQRD